MTKSFQSISVSRTFKRCGCFVFIIIDKKDFR